MCWWKVIRCCWLMGVGVDGSGCSCCIALVYFLSRGARAVARETSGGNQPPLTTLLIHTTKHPTPRTFANTTPISNMLANTLLRTTSRRMISASSRSANQRTASTSVTQTLKKKGEDARRAVLPLMAVATVGSLGLMTLRKEEVRSLKGIVPVYPAL